MKSYPDFSRALASLGGRFSFGAIVGAWIVIRVSGKMLEKIQLWYTDKN